MTAAHGRPLRVVPDPGDTVEEPSTAHVGAQCPDVAELETWEAQQVFDQWDPEHQLIGALMWLSAERARPILELVPDTAIWRPTIRWAYQIIRSLVDEGRDPDPGGRVCGIDAFERWPDAYPMRSIHYNYVTNFRRRTLAPSNTRARSSA